MRYDEEQALSECLPPASCDATHVYKMSQSGRVAVLAYHSLDEEGSILSTPPSVFANQMQVLCDQGLRVVPLRQLGEVFCADAAADNVVVITFDDGFRSVYEYGLPVLQQYGFPATIFLVTDYCGRSNSWPGQPAYVRRAPLLRWSEVREMTNCGVSFGSHTCSHPNLTMVARHRAEEELVNSKNRIEAATGQPVHALAYPYGAYDGEIVALAQTHFEVACSTSLGFVRSWNSPLQLARLDMYYLRHELLFRRLFSSEVGAYLDVRRRLRDARQRLLSCAAG